MSLLDPPANLVRLIHTHILVEDEEKEEEEEVVGYVAFLALGLAHTNQYDPKTWHDVLSPYFTHAGEATKTEEWENKMTEFCYAAQEELANDDDDADSYGGDEDDDLEELCNLRFNLAYGGKILLHGTKLRLCRGRRYALVGQNGVGKTTLMNAISNGKIDGWPHHLTTAYVDSGSNVDPAYERQNVMQHLLDSTKRTREECIEKMKELDFTEEMMEGEIGALSGGWQMKLRLIRAVLINPDIYLLDEPTNHLSESAVKWITDYVCSLDHQTVLCVSHDTTFLVSFKTERGFSPGDRYRPAEKASAHSFTRHSSPSLPVAFHHTRKIYVRM